VQRILLPVSVKARDDMQRMLEARGFAVHRVDAYDSASVPWNHEQTALAVSAPVVALASPTAIQVYLKKKRSTC
jgi:uroporphyrinogen-III synthase